MIYCMSDIHGEYDRFKDMLKLIQFSAQDELYIIGDVIDRFPQGIDILFDIMDRPNVYMLLGNHELMLLQTLGPDNVIGARDLWKLNGGYTTYIDLVYQRTPKERQKVVEYLSSLPDFLEIDVKGNCFHLVHGTPADDSDSRLWGRPEKNMDPPMAGKTAIVGHTPTIFLHDESSDDNFDPFRIWHGNGIICIDCCCGHENIKERKLACIRLDDMKEFYI